MKEIWKDIKGYEGLYQISSLGRVKSLNYNNTKLERLMKPPKNSKGYLNLQLFKNKQKRAFSVHRVVAQTFIPNSQSKSQVNHINGIKSDNRVENLEWVTAKENMQHACSNGLITTYGTNNAKSKLNESDIVNIRKLYPHKNYTEIAYLYNMNRTTISDIVNFKTWKHVKE